MEQIQDQAIYTTEQVAKLLQLTSKTVRVYLKRVGMKTVGNRYRITGIEVKELLNTIRGNKQ